MGVYVPHAPPLSTLPHTPLPAHQAVGLGQDDGKKLTDEYVRQQLSGIGIGDGCIGSRATLVVDHSAIGEGGQHMVRTKIKGDC